MNASAKLLSPSEAANRLGVSAKALRLYEERGLVSPIRNASGWRFYGPEEMARARDIVNLRDLGLSLAEVAHVLEGDSQGLETALAAHQKALEDRTRALAGTVDRIRRMRADLAKGETPVIGDLACFARPEPAMSVAFELPWPWGGELFELRDVRSLNFIVGPLGSGKTRLAMRLAKSLTGGVFLGWERTDDSGASARARLEADGLLKAKVDRDLAWLIDEGAIASDALIVLLVGLEANSTAPIVIDMLEHGLNDDTQSALISLLRHRRHSRPPLFFTTRSNAILDLEVVEHDEVIILCPANHSPPTLVAPYPGAPGFEAVATCLATPRVRARTEGIITILRPAG